MRHLLIDRARARAVRDQGRKRLELSLDAFDLASTGRFDDLLVLDAAIEHLASKDAALAELVRLRFFTGLTIEETAEVLGASARTVNRDWNYARALLAQFLKGAE
jgi:DNA-directed RNA polymerase specialized sigma24 family protein